MTDIETRAKNKWNFEADAFNQWSELSLDEKTDLVEDMAVKVSVEKFDFIDFDFVNETVSDFVKENI